MSSHDNGIDSGAANSLNRTLVVVSLGSNQSSRWGDPLATVRTAMTNLLELVSPNGLCSSFWMTSPVDCAPGEPDFVNAVMAWTAKPGESAESLLQILKAMETRFGRSRTSSRNSARTLDLDLICWGNRVQTSAELTLPHPRAHLRGFVLKPLAEICPDLILPGQSRTIGELASGLPESGEEKIVKGFENP